MAKRKKESGNMVESKPFDDKRWQAEQDLESLGRAHAVRSDPDRLKRCKVLAKEKSDAFKQDRDAANYKLDLAEGEEK